MPAKAKVLELEFNVSAPPAEVYAAWMSSKKHTAMTGGAAEIQPRVGGRFSAWDGYIQGETLELERGKRVVQSWRTTDFGPKEPDSKLEVHFLASGRTTRVRFLHHGLSAAARRKYKEGWVDFYVEPMQAYFAARSAKS